MKKILNFHTLNKICLTLSITGFIGAVLSAIYFLLFQSKSSVIIGVSFFELFVVGLINWFLTIGLSKDSNNGTK